MNLENPVVRTAFRYRASAHDKAFPVHALCSDPLLGDSWGVIRMVISPLL